MKDRFKFRVWYEPKGITSDKPIMIYNAEDTYDCMAGKPFIIYKSCFGDVLEDDEYTVMQCTGLKDKNDKLIYEGDIVKTWKFSTGEISNKVVAWNEARCGCRLYTIDHFKRGIVFSPQSMVHVTTIEVIGNIYENPELLEEY